MKKLKVLAAFAALSSIVCADTVQELEKAFDKAVSSGQPLSAERAFKQLLEKGAKLSANRYRQAAEVARQLGKNDERNARIAHFLKVEKNLDADAMRLAYELSFFARNAEALSLIAAKNVGTKDFFSKSMDVLSHYINAKRASDFKVAANALLAAYTDGAKRNAIYGRVYDMLASGTPGFSTKDVREMAEKYPPSEAYNLSRIINNRQADFSPIWRLRLMAANPSTILDEHAFSYINNIVQGKDNVDEKIEAGKLISKLRPAVSSEKYVRQFCSLFKLRVDLKDFIFPKEKENQQSADLKAFFESIASAGNNIARSNMRDIISFALHRGAFVKSDIVALRDKYPMYMPASVDRLYIAEECDKAKSTAPFDAFMAKLPKDDIRIKDEFNYNALRMFSNLKNVAKVKSVVEKYLSYDTPSYNNHYVIGALDDLQLPDAELVKYLKSLLARYGSQFENDSFWNTIKAWNQLKMHKGTEFKAFIKTDMRNIPPSDKLLAAANKMRSLRRIQNNMAPEQAHQLFAEACALFPGRYPSDDVGKNKVFGRIISYYVELCRHSTKSAPICLDALLSKVNKEKPNAWGWILNHHQWLVHNSREKPEIQRKALIAYANATKNLSVARDIIYPAKTDKLDFATELYPKNVGTTAFILSRNWSSWNKDQRYFTPRLASEMVCLILNNINEKFPNDAKSWFANDIFAIAANIIYSSPRENFKGLNLDKISSVILTGKAEDDVWAISFLRHICAALNQTDKYFKIFAKAIANREPYERVRILSSLCSENITPVVKGSLDEGFGYALKNHLIPALKSVDNSKAPLVTFAANNNVYGKIWDLFKGVEKPEKSLLSEYVAQSARLLTCGARGFTDDWGNVAMPIYRDAYKAMLAQSNAVELVKIARNTGRMIRPHSWGTSHEEIEEIVKKTALLENWDALYLLISAMNVYDKRIQTLIAKYRALSSKHLPGIYPVSERDPLYPLYVAADELSKNNTERATSLLMKNLTVFEKDAIVLPPDFIAWGVDQMRMARGKDGVLLVKARTLASRLLEDESKLSAELAAALLLVRAECNRDQQNFEVAKLEYQSIRNNPAYAKTKYGRKAMYRDVDLLIEMGNSASAEPTLEYWLSQPDVEIQAQAHYFLARIAYDRKDYEECRKQLKEVFSIDFTHTEGRFLEGRWKLATGNEVDDTEVMIGDLSDRTMIRPGQQLTISVQDRNLSVAGGGASIPVVIQTSPGKDRERIYLYPTPRDPTLFRGVIDVKLGESVVSNLTLEVSGKDVASYNIDMEFLKARGLPIPPPKKMRVVDDARLIVGTGSPRAEEDESNAKKIEDIIDSADLASYRVPSLRPGNPLHIAVMDKDMSKGGESTVSVKVSTSSGDVLENVVMEEIRPYSGIFRGEIPTSLPPPRAFASDTAVGFNPGDVISTKRNGGWRSLSDSKKGKSFSVDTMGSHLFSNIVVKMSSAEELRRFRVVGKIGGDQLELARFPAAPSEGRAGLYRWTANAGAVRGEGGVKTFFDSNPSIKPKAVTDISCLGKKDRNGKPCVSYIKGAFVVDSSNETFRLLIAPVKSGTTFRNLWLSILVDGVKVVTGYGPTLTNQIVSRRLTRGCHTIEVFSIQSLDDDAWVLNWNPPGEEPSPIPNSWFDAKVHPEINEYLADKAVITRDGEGFNITFRNPTRLRSFTMEFLEHLSPGISLSKISAADWSGKAILPVDTDFSDAQRNGTLEVAPGDSISVRYEDAVTSSGRARVVNKSLGSSFNDARLGFYFEQIVVDRDNVYKNCYSAYRFLPGDTLLVGVTDPDLDATDQADTVEVVITKPDGEKQKLLLVEQEGYLASGGKVHRQSEDIEGIHTGFFLGLLPTHQQGVTNGIKKASVACSSDSELIVSYEDRENTSPGVPFVRTIRVAATKESDAKISVFNSRNIRVVDTSRAAQAKIMALRRRAGNEKIDRLYTNYVTASLVDRAVVNSTNDIPANIAAPLFVRINAPSLARHSQSYIVMEAVTESELARAELDGDTPDVKTTRVRLASAFNGGSLSNGRESNEEALLNGSFNGTIKFMMGDIDQDMLGISSRSDDEAYQPIALPVAGYDRIHVSFKDSEGKELVKRTFSLISDAEMDLVDSSLAAERTAVHVGERFYVKVSDADRDSTEDPDGIEVSVETTGGTRRKIILTESLPHSGVFSGSVRPTILPPTETIPSVITGATATAEEILADDRIPVKFGERIIVKYTDNKVLPGSHVSTLCVTGTVYKGADGSVRLFSKRFRDVDAAVLVQFRLAECLFEQAKDFRKLKQGEKSAEAIAKGRQILEEALKNNPESTHVAQGEFLLANLYQELAAEEEVLAKQLRNEGEEEDAEEASKKSRQLYAEALARFSSILAVWPEGEYAPRAQYHKAYCLEMLKDFKLAGEEYVKMTYMYPESDLVGDATIRLATYYFREEKKYETAARIYESFARRFPNHDKAARALFMSGSCYIKEGEAIHRRAVEAARLAAEKAKRKFNANQTFLPFASVENYTRAVNAFVDMAEKYQAVTTPELRAQGLYWAGDASLRKDDVKSAYIFLKRAVLEYPETEWARRARGLLLQNGKKFKGID